MPYYRWRGVNLLGKWCRGTSFARSNAQLEKQLLKRDIAVTRTKHIKRWYRKKKITHNDTIQFFQQLTSLLQSGLLLPECLSLLIDQVHNPSLQELISEISDAVHNGTTFSAGLAQHPHTFDSLMIGAVHIGQESSNLAMTLKALTVHLQTMQDFHKKIRAAALLPAITVGVFFLVANVVFLIIIPQFANMFASVGSTLPPLTRMLLAASNFTRSWHAFALLNFMVIFGIILKLYSQTIEGQSQFQKLLLHTPIAKNVIRHVLFMRMFKSLSLLIKSGIPLLQSIEILRNGTNNVLESQYYTGVYQTVLCGGTLSDGLQKIPDNPLDTQSIALIQSGENSGQLSMMLEHVSNQHQQQLETLLVKFTTLLQPALMITIGLFITLLLLAVYLPIFNLASVIG